MPDTPAVIDLLALAWLLAGVLLGLIRGLAPLFSWLLWVIASLWLASVVSPVLLGWLTNTQGADAPHARFLAYGSLVALALGLPLLGRLLGSRRGQPRQASPGARDKSLGVVAGLVCALLTFTVALPFLGAVDRLAPRSGRAVAPSVSVQVAKLLPWLYPPEHRQALGALDAPPPSTAEDTGTSWEPVPPIPR